MTKIDEYFRIVVPSTLKKDGIINYLNNLGFFTAPASSKYHGNYEGGLFDHSAKVTEELVRYTENLGLKWRRSESPYIIGMFHDLCKCDLYIEEPLYQFDSSLTPYKINKEDSFPGHGEKSIMILSQILPLTEEEVYCIRYHMGAYNTDEWNYYDRAIRKYPNVLWTHTADMSASKIFNI